MTTYAIVQPHPDFRLRIVGDDTAIRMIEFDVGHGEPGWIEDPGHPLIREAARQLEEYFQGKRRQFDLALRLRGTPFQKRVWGALQAIPYGTTRSYADIARGVGSPLGARAVGQANSANPLAIVVPCHRVIAADGTLGGYRPGLERKRFLLDLESALTLRVPPSPLPGGSSPQV